MKPVVLAGFAACLVAGCVPLTNGQNGLLFFEGRGPLALGETLVMTARSNASCPSFGSTLTLDALTPDVVSITDVAASPCGVTGTLHANAVGHGQIRATLGPTNDTVDFWVAVPDHLLVTGDTRVIGAPIDPDVVHVARSDRAILHLELRTASEIPLQFTSTPVITTAPTGVVDVEVTPSHMLLVTARAPGSVMLTVSVLGLSDTLTVVVDP